MSKIDEMSPTQVEVAREDYLWNRKYDARQGIGFAIRDTLHCNTDRRTGKVDGLLVIEIIEGILGAVVAERRCLMVGTLIELWERYYPFIGTESEERRVAQHALRRVLDDAVEAQIAGIVSLFGGAS